MSVNHESATLLESGAVSLSEHPSPLARRNLQRLGLSALLLFCVTSTIGLAYIVNVNNQVLAMLLQQQQQQPSFGTSSSTVQPLRVYTQKLDTQYTAGSDTGAARVLIVHAAGTHLAKLARAVQEGVELVVSSADNLRVRTLENATFEEDVMWADAIILGTHVINANVEPKMAEFVSTWSLRADLSHKVAAVFVTSGGMSAGEELTMVNLLHSMMIFRMIIAGGERWTSAFGASAVVSEGPFQPVAKVQNSGYQQFPTVCYPTDPDEIHEMFKDKAVGLGRRIATLASVLQQHLHQL